MNYELRSVKSESKRRAKRTRCTPFSTLHSSPFTLRVGTTLIELLVTITIIAILSATFLGVSNLAMDSAREARTKTTIGKLHTLLMENWNSYATRRVDIDTNVIQQLRINIEASSLSDSQKRRAFGLASADLRLLATRELMASELPDSWSDILNEAVGTPPASIPTDPRILGAFPALRASYLRRYYQVTSKTPPGTGNNTEIIEANQGAECLYLIIMLATGDGEARTLFSEQDIGDTDGDGAPEFLDGWGRPIHFIRWAPGFVARSDLMSGDADSDHDPTDVFRRDQPGTARPGTGAYPIISTFINELGDMTPAFRLMPLVYSAGSDGETDIDDLHATGTTAITSLDPYAIDPSPAGLVFVPFVDNFVFGFPFDKNNDGDDNSLDNIHNHLQDNK